MKKRFIPKNSPEGQMLQRMMNGGRYDLPRYQMAGLSPEDEFLKEINRVKPYDPLNTRPPVMNLEGINQASDSPYENVPINRANIPYVIPQGFGYYNRASGNIVMAPTEDKMQLGTVGTTLDFSRYAPADYKPTATGTPHVSGRTLLKQGSRGDEVKQLQEILKAKGFYTGAIDGIYGKNTAAAVAKFQSEFNKMSRDFSLNNAYTDVVQPGKNILVDGIVGDETRAALLATTARKFYNTSNNTSKPRGTSYKRNYQVEDSYMPSPGPVEMDYLGGLAMAGAMGLPFLIPEASALGATEAALATAARQAAGQAARQAPNVTRTPSSYGTRIGYQQGGETMDNEMMKQVLAEFMQTLPPEEQDAFVEQFMQMRPEEQQMVVQKIMEMLTQSAQGMDQQAMPDERAAMEQAAMQQQGMMQDGGDIPTYLEFDRDMSNVEVEGGETAMLPDGGLFRFEGPKHAQGGVPTMLPGGTKVFSEHLKVPKYIAEGILNRKSKKKYSYADLSKKFPTAKYEKILMDPRADEYAKRTADIQLQRNQTMLETIFEAQEMAKGNTQQPMDYSMVDTEQMMVRGGMFPYNRNFKVAGYGPRQSSGNPMGTGRRLPIAQDGVLQIDDDFEKFWNKVINFETKRGGPSGSQAPQYNTDSYKNMFRTIYDSLDPKDYPSPQLRARAADWLWRAGWDQQNNKPKFDPRGYITQEYLRQRQPYQPQDWDANWGWTGRGVDFNNSPAHNAVYREVLSLSPEEQQQLMTNAQNWFYRNRTRPEVQIQRDNAGKYTGRDRYGAIDSDYEKVWAPGIANLAGEFGSFDDPAYARQVHELINIGNYDDYYRKLTTDPTPQRAAPGSFNVFSDESGTWERRVVPPPSQGTPTPQQTPGASSPSTFPNIPPGQSQLWTKDQTELYGTDDYIRPDYSSIPGYNPNYLIGNYNMDITVPNLQRKRQDQKGYGKQPYLSDPYMNIFTQTFPEYFSEHPNFNRNSRQDWTDFQEWHNEESDRLGRKRYFDGSRKFSKVDGYPGAYTMHAPSFKRKQTPPPAATTPPVAATTPEGTTTPAAERTEPAPVFAFSSPSPVETKSKFGISPKLAGTVLDIGLALSDRLRIDHPDYRDLRKYPMFRRFTDFDDQEISQQQAAAIQNVQNSKMPEQVKQSMIANITANAAKQQGAMDLQNQGRYDQWLEGNLNKLQGYADSNINQQAQDIDRYQQQKARVNFLRDQFNAQKKSRIVNSVRDYLDYVDKINMANQLKSSEYRTNPFTGRIKYKGHIPDALKQREQELAEYARVSGEGMPLAGGATYYPSIGVIIGPDGKPLQLTRQSLKSE